MTPGPVTSKRIRTATKYGIANAGAAAVACRRAGIPFFVACALLEKESGGRNIYGHDRGGAFSGAGDTQVTDINFMRFLTLVFGGQTSNGVGPCQITYKGYFPIMLDRGLNPADPLDNMTFGFELLAANYRTAGTWELAGARYNGGGNPNASARAYGADLQHRITQWKNRLEIR